MAVERLTDYTRRIWTGLAADAPDPDMQAGDVIYYMDTSKCSIITGIPAPGSIDTIDLPDIGGGGGGSTIVSKTITANGTYYASSDSADGYNPVTVNVPASPPQYENFVFMLDNQVGSPMGFVSMFYDSNISALSIYIYAQHNSGATIQKTCLIQNGKVQIGWTNVTVHSITYNGNPVPFTLSGTGGRRYAEFEVPENFDFDIPIIFS